MMETQEIVTMDIETEFWQDYEAIRKKFPMVYWGVWTPNDFVNGGETFIGDEERGEVVWNDPEHIETVENIQDNHDANYGVNWELIQDCRVLPERNQLEEDES